MSPLAEVVWDRDVDPDGAVTRYLEQTSALLEPYIALALDAPDRVVVTGDRDVVLGALGLPLPPIVGPLPPYAAVVLHPGGVRGDGAGLRRIDGAALRHAPGGRGRRGVSSREPALGHDAHHGGRH